jgi:hypothetical protein
MGLLSGVFQNDWVGAEGRGFVTIMEEMRNV